MAEVQSTGRGATTRAGQCSIESLLIPQQVHLPEQGVSPEGADHRSPGRIPGEIRFRARSRDISFDRPYGLIEGGHGIRK